MNKSITMRAKRKQQKLATYKRQLLCKIKRCGLCKKGLPWSSFYKLKTGKFGLQDRCKACMRKMHRKYKRKDKEVYRNIRRKSLLKIKYNLTPELYTTMHKRQNDKCAICGLSETEKFVFASKKEPYRLSIDHNHTTGKVRGLLCKACNRGLGSFKDSAILLKKALTYLEHYD